MTTAILILVTVALYAHTWMYGLVIDDVNRLQKPSRPFDLMTCLRGSGVGSHNTRVIYGEHILGTFLHLTAVLLVERLAGFYAALLFAVHPHALQTCVWLNGKRYIVGTIIVLVSLVFHAIGGVGLLAAYWQPSTAIAGLLGALRGSWWSIAVMVAVAVYIKAPQKIYRRFKSRNKEIPSEVSAPASRWILCVKLYGAYFFRTIAPGYPAMFYPELGQYDMAEVDAKRAEQINVDFVQGITAIILSAYFVSIVQMFVLFPLSLAPYLHITRRNVVQLNADRYAYCASVFVFSVIGLVPVLSVGLAAWYTIMTIIGSRQYRDMEQFTAYNYEKYPTSSRASYYHALKQWEKGYDQTALVTAEHGLELNPQSYDLLFLAAVCARNTELKDTSRQYATRAAQNTYVGQKSKQVERCEKLI